MVEKPSSTGQIKKLAFNKYLSDEKGVTWKLSTWKVTFWLIGIIVSLIIIFSFFQEDQGIFLKDVLFYGIITMILILVIWIVAAFVMKSRKIFFRFLVGWILLLGLYAGMGFICEMTGLYPNGFHYGFATWMLLSTLAISAKNIGDGNIDRKDLFFCMLVFVIFFIANAPIFSGGMGFLAQVDSVLGWIMARLSFINPQDLIAS